MKRSVLIFLLTLTPLLLSALDCSVCGKRIHGNYIKTDNAVYCTKRCFLSTMPTCAGCGRKCERQVITMMGKKFCSRQCMHNTYRCYTCGQGADNMIGMYSSAEKQVLICPQCSKRPKCYFCAMPCDRKPPLRDGRRICQTCRKTAVTDHNQIRRIYQEVRRNMGIWFGFDQRHKIELVIVPVRELEKRSNNIYLPDGGRRLSLMNYEREVTEKRYYNGKKQRYISKERCRIYILDSIPALLLYDTLAHELTHDYLRHNLGEVKVLADEEGFCELMASIYNEKTGNAGINKLKEEKKDPVYGGGYRRMRSIYLRNGRNWKQALRSIRAGRKEF